MIQVRISEDMLADGISVYLSRKYDGGQRQVLHVVQGGSWTEWADLTQVGQADVPPTIRLTDELGRALLDALLRHYQGASDMHTLRSDYLHERERVDRLIGVVADVARQPAPVTPLREVRS